MMQTHIWKQTQNKDLPFPRWIQVILVFNLAATALIGAFKGLPIFASLRLDLTLLTAAIAAVSLLFRTSNSSGQAVAFVAVLWFAFIPGIIMAEANNLPPLKYGYLFTITLVSALATARLVEDPRTRDLLSFSHVIFGLAMALFIQVYPSSIADSTYARANIEGGSTITTARVLAAGAVAGIFLGISRTALTRIALWSISLLCILLSISVGSRGPVLAALVAVGLASLSSRGPVKERLRALIVGCVVLGGTAAVLLNTQSYAAQRVLSIIRGESDPIRTYYVDMAAASISFHPLGVGWGGFARIIGQPESGISPAYPHNLVLEIFLEAGWLSGAIVCILVLLAIVRGWRNSSDPSVRCLLALTIYWLFNAMVSSDINGNRALWVCAVCLMGISNFATTKRPLVRPFQRKVIDGVKTR